MISHDGDGETRVLVVGDVPENVEKLNSILSEEYKMLFATNGPNCLKIVQTEKPDIVIMDIRIPDMDDFQLCLELRLNAGDEELPIMFIEDNDSDEDEEFGINLRFVDYITKPIKPAIIKLRVRNQLELKLYRGFFKEMSARDVLTNINNRQRFDECITKEWKRAIRSGFSLSLIIIDIDYLKKFNDNYGRVAGDDCLRRVAQSIKKSLTRVTDMVARYSGEEFCCILPETGYEGAFLLAQKIKDAISALKIQHEHSLANPYISISSGVATILPDNKTAFSKLIDEADRCLSQAKQEGRNRVVGKSC